MSKRSNCFYWHTFRLVYGNRDVILVAFHHVTRTRDRVRRVNRSPRSNYYRCLPAPSLCGVPNALVDFPSIRKFGKYRQEAAFGVVTGGGRTYYNYHTACTYTCSATRIHTPIQTINRFTRRLRITRTVEQPRSRESADIRAAFSWSKKKKKCFFPSLVPFYRPLIK